MISIGHHRILHSDVLMAFDGEAYIRPNPLSHVVNIKTPENYHSEFMIATNAYFWFVCKDARTNEILDISITILPNGKHRLMAAYNCGGGQPQKTPFTQIIFTEEGHYFQESVVTDLPFTYDFCLDFKVLAEKTIEQYLKLYPEITWEWNYE